MNHKHPFRKTYLSVAILSALTVAGCGGDDILSMGGEGPIVVKTEDQSIVLRADNKTTTTSEILAGSVVADVGDAYIFKVTLNASATSGPFGSVEVQVVSTKFGVTDSQRLSVVRRATLENGDRIFTLVSEGFEAAASGALRVSGDGSMTYVGSLKTSNTDKPLVTIDGLGGRFVSSQVDSLTESAAFNFIDSVQETGAGASKSTASIGQLRFDARVFNDQLTGAAELRCTGGLLNPEAIDAIGACADGQSRVSGSDSGRLVVNSEDGYFDQATNAIPSSGNITRRVTIGSVVDVDGVFKVNTLVADIQTADSMNPSQLGRGIYAPAAEVSGTALAGKNMVCRQGGLEYGRLTFNAAGSVAEFRPNQNRSEAIKGTGAPNDDRNTPNVDERGMATQYTVRTNVMPTMGQTTSTGTQNAPGFVTLEKSLTAPATTPDGDSFEACTAGFEDAAANNPVNLFPLLGGPLSALAGLFQGDTPAVEDFDFNSLLISDPYQTCLAAGVSAIPALGPLLVDGTRAIFVGELLFNGEPEAVAPPPAVAFETRFAGLLSNSDTLHLQFPVSAMANGENAALASGQNNTTVVTCRSM